MSVSTEDIQATFVATVVDEWIRAGIRHAVVCPGSRSTPLAVALAARPEMRVHVRLDERGACFYAVGLAMATGMPAVLCTTSGTAAAELHAGIVEAHHARVPLIACTADRPSRLHHVGAPQTIEQRGLFGPLLRWFCDPGPLREEDWTWWRSMAARAVGEAIDGGGPVHLNLAFDEPLLGVAGALPPVESSLGTPPRRSCGSVPSLSTKARWDRPGLIIAGADAGPPELLIGVAERLGWPLLADPRSRARRVHPCVVGAADALLRDPVVRASLLPETILVLGQPWASRVVSEFIVWAAGAGAHLVAVGAELSDPGRVVQEFYPIAPGSYLNALGALDAPPQPQTWSRRWRDIEAVAQGAITEVLSNDPLSEGDRATEPSVARHLWATLDAETVLFVGSSMPVRDLEWFAEPRPAPPPVLSNRGANGIDGVTSSALGAAASEVAPVVALIGDLAFFHDASALVSVGEERGSCTLVVLDNHGGGIFNFLPQAHQLDGGHFEQLFGTPPTASVSALARACGVPVSEVATLAELQGALDAVVGREPRAVIRVEVPAREDNVALHERVHEAVAHAARHVLAQ